MKDSTMPEVHTGIHTSDVAVLSPDAVRRLSVSVLVDGEADITDWDAVWDGADESQTEVQAAWHCYHLIGDVLRADDGRAPWIGSGATIDVAGSIEFARRVTSLAQQQGMLAQVPMPAPTQPLASAPPEHAANDSVFRWKMVAGLASFTVVLGMAWGVAGDLAPGEGGVLAVAPARVPEVSVQVAGEVPLLVATPQGQVMRDARLQELVQAHRQLGGVSALQAPAGFLRTSTLDPSQR